MIACRSKEKPHKFASRPADALHVFMPEFMFNLCSLNMYKYIYMSSKKGPFTKQNIFQPSIFRGHVSFQGGFYSTMYIYFYIDIIFLT